MTESNNTHFIGIGGIGMSALAQILLDKQLNVSGSDLSVSEMTQKLTQRGAVISNNHAENNVKEGDTVIFNSQICKNNPEFLAALSLKCSLLHRSELLASLTNGYKSLAVAGTHGKTTTSALLTTALIDGGFDPTFALGGLCKGKNGQLGKGEFFVLEADESDGSFLNYHPFGAIVTNVEAEHLDHYQNVENLYNAFQKFIQKIQNPTLFFYCGDDPGLIALNPKGMSYGFEPHNKMRILNYSQTGWISNFDLVFEGKTYSNIQLALIGKHNALNAAAVFGLGLKLGLSENSLRETFKTFSGIGRRCEKKAEFNNMLFYDDYAHHPTEIATTLQAVKTAIQERRLVAIFEPHRYSRVRDFMADFARAFEWADLLIVTDIYPAFEKPIEGIDSPALLQAIQKSSTVPSKYVPKENLSSEIHAILKPHDVLITLGAGSISAIHKKLYENLQPKKITIGLIFGGESCEHEISIRSARFIAHSLDRTLYDLHFFAIDKEGCWVTGVEAKNLLDCCDVVTSNNAKPLLDPEVTLQLNGCDLYLPILHGSHGEDGTIQGFFEMLGKAYVGPDYRSAAICMDKVLTKKLVSKEGIATPRDIHFSYRNWLENKEKILKEIGSQLKLPFFVKPVHLGSSIGITYIDDFEKLAAAIEFAFQKDTDVMVEEGKVGCRELEFAVLGNAGSFPVQVPGPGEKLAQGDFVDYEKKYGKNAVKTTLHPELSKKLLEKGKKAAREAYVAVGCTGMTRVDFLLDGEGEFWLFEMNTIPGMQQLSLFPKIWHREGVEAAQLLDQLIILAMARHRQKHRHGISTKKPKI